MIKEENKMFKRVVVYSDLVIVIGAFFIGYFLRDRIYDIYPLSAYIGLLPVLLLVWIGLLFYFGVYKSLLGRKIPDVLLAILKTTIVGFIIFGSYIFILRMHDISRMFIGFTFVIAATLITLEKVAFIYMFRALYKKGVAFKSALIIFRSILIIGTGKRTKRFIDLIHKNPDCGIKIIGLVDMDPARKGKIIHGYKVIGTFEDIPEIIHKDIVDEVVFIVPRSWLDKIEDIMYFCESEGLNVNLAVDLFELKFSKAKQTDLQGFPFLAFESTAGDLWHLFIKRLFDFVLSGIALIILAPIFVIIAIVIKVTSEGPVFFKQERCSLYGRKFIFYKFRTMVVDAESQLKDILRFNEMNGPVFKMTEDPRITKAGKWLRKFSIDELPQLWNVVKGDMSLVGPRPPIPAEVENYNNWQRRRLSMRPGITCLWQISGRSEIADFSEWMKLDLEYIDNWSLWLDFKILLKTVPVVLFGVGAK